MPIPRTKANFALEMNAVANRASNTVETHLKVISAIVMRGSSSPMAVARTSMNAGNGDIAPTTVTTPEGASNATAVSSINYSLTIEPAAWKEVIRSFYSLLTIRSVDLRSGTT